ncbi:MAG: asparaginase [Silicimonas sp.]|jgi:L-asparaginase II|nr:asparaginase [Silicimonas sp.]
MLESVALAEVTRGPFVESRHFGHAVITRADGEIVEAWGDPSKVVLPRSSAKMLQALPLLESGAGAHLDTRQLALACASHSGEQRHVDLVNAWLADLGLDEHALCCGPQPSQDEALFEAMIREGVAPTRVHNNCSGKHAGFLTLTRHLNASPDYVDPEHPVQRAVRTAMEEVCDEQSAGFGIDGCSAPNFAVSLAGMARGMAAFAVAGQASGARDRAMSALRDAMMAHPELVSGKGRACAAMMQAARGGAAVKTGAEGFYIAILPGLKLGVALKIEDGATRGAEAAMAAILVRLGVADASDPLLAPYLAGPIENRNRQVVGELRPAPGLVERA